MADRLRDGCSYELWTADIGSATPRQILTKWWTDLAWARAQSSTTQATVSLTKSGPDGPCLFADDMATVMQDIVVRRGGITVWRGPMSRIVEKRDTIDVTALDSSAWFGTWHTVDRAFDLGGVDLSDVMAAYIEHALGQYPGGVSVPPVPPIGVTATRTTLPGVTSADKDLGELAKTGCPWTMAPDLLLGPNTAPAIPLSDSDLSGDVSLVEDGEAWASRVWQNGEGTIQQIVGGPVGGIMKDVVLSDPQIKDELSALWAAQRYQSTLGGPIPPVVLSIASGATINGDAPVTVHDLVPGQRFRFDLSPEWQRRAQTAQSMTLTNVKVSQSKGGIEKIEVQFQPGVGL